MSKIFIGVELECLLRKDLYPDNPITYSIDSSICNYWLAHTDSSITTWKGNREFVPKFSKRYSERRGGYTKELSGFLGKHIELEASIQSDRDYRSIEMVTTSLSGGNPLELRELPIALSELGTRLALLDESPTYKAFIVNPSTGCHLHISDNDTVPEAIVAAGVLSKAKSFYMHWLTKNRSAFDARIFHYFYRRAEYVHKNDTFVTEDRYEFAHNLGIEWRGFHIIGTTTWQDTKERIMAGANALAKAYTMAKEKNMVTLALANDITIPFSGIKFANKTFKFHQLFTREIPCAI